MNARYRMTIGLRGIRCAGCFNSIEILFRRRGAEAVEIDPVTRIASVTYVGAAAEADDYCAAVRAAGYQATLFAVLPAPASDEASE